MDMRSRIWKGFGKELKTEEIWASVYMSFISSFNSLFDKKRFFLDLDLDFGAGVWRLGVGRVAFVECRYTLLRIEENELNTFYCMLR